MEPTAISAPISPGGFRSVERQRVGGNDGERLGGMQLRDKSGEVVEGAAYARILEKRAENRLGIQIPERVADDDLPAERLRARLEHG